MFTKIIIPTILPSVTHILFSIEIDALQKKRSTTIEKFNRYLSYNIVQKKEKRMNQKKRRVWIYEIQI